MLFFAVPFMFEAEAIMKLWLKNYPPEAPLFLRLSLIGTMIDLLGNSPAIAAWATGDIKRYYIYVSSVGCLVFPLSWLAFTLGMPAYISYVIFIIVYIGVLFTKLYIIKGLIGFSIGRYCRDVLLIVAETTIVAFFVPLIVYNFLERSPLSSFFVLIASLFFSLIAIYVVGLSMSERKKVTNFAYNKVRNIL